ncbi:aminotransferase class IV [Patescibacteria group bacterium]|nr:aminotransferase class IV [Patescibacteria group bacterium]
MQAKYVSKNGELVESGDANISVYNKALFFDFAVYSNIKVVGGKMFLPELEIEKLLESAAAIGIKYEVERDELVKWAEKLVEKNELKDALIRILLVGPEVDNEVQLFMFPVGLTFYPKQFYQQGVKLIIYKGERFFPTAKTKNLLMSYLAYQEAVKREALDALLVDRDNNIIEGTRCSFYVIKGDELIVPPASKTLEGITKKIILEIALQILSVREADIPLASITGYDEYFISATTMKIMPVREIDGQVVAEQVGEKTRELQRLFAEYAEKT